MKLHHILKDFKGNQTGNGETEHFKAGTAAKLSNDLAAIAVKESWAEPVSLETVAAPVTGLDAPVPGGDLERDLANPAALRETKVSGPEESKPDLAALGQKELLAVAKDNHGLELKGNTSKADILKAIEAARAAA